ATAFIAVPTGIKFFNWLATLWGGRISLNSAMLFSCGFIVNFVLGGITGVALAQVPFDIHVHDTYFVVGHFHLMIGGVTMFGMFAGIYYWFPKMFGRLMHEGLGKAHFWATFVPFFMVFFAQHFQGLQGMPRRYYAFSTYEYLREAAAQNGVISMLAIAVVAGQFIFLANFLWSLFRGRVAGEDPWQATTLEWTVPSPPPHGNFV
ncbi:MAG TPA: cytochrome c oxidase subunit I, partial [Gemmatimonadetes bacterium]|nr:cytochrome c oxidase subunit I [Gemmatimonadota bacterium]